ncbi:GTP cyclohydrolase II [Alkalihalobacillus oceani]|uniref:GTP cyclohydrolase II n=1 Tax=Halalkalibacter oceani TaxID=1653776 RepID=A0A9X2DMD2_9BACI|nr:GTP cyclohydrolase II [Halalkalibacter oceani]MCM3713441.1 GTP cyclohydrolase II [Halalkalibacter oceani]
MSKSTMKHYDEIATNYLNKVSSRSGSLLLLGPVPLPLDVNGKTVSFNWYTWIHQTEECKELSVQESIKVVQGNSMADKQVSSVLVYGDFENAEQAFVRFHSICHTGDVFGSQKCDCGEQFREAKQMIVEHGCGAIFYIANQEGRGIGLFHKAMAYLLQQQGMDTVEANLALGFDDDLRTYEEPAAILKFLRKRPIDLMTNNPHKLEKLQQAGIRINKRIPAWCSLTPDNERYIQTKIKRSGHLQSETNPDFTYSNMSK